MQRHRLLLTLTAITSSVNSDLQNVNGYEVNNVQRLGGGIVNFSNVRFFLSNNVNSVIVNDFFSYLTISTTTIEFTEIYNSDEKLSNVFNNYYNSSVLNNTIPSTFAIDESLSGTTGMTVINNSYFNLDGVAPTKGLYNIPLSIDNSTRKLEVYSALTTFTTEPSYYIPVFIKRNTSQLDREKLFFEEITQLIITSAPDEGPSISLGYGYYGASYSADTTQY